MAKRKKQKHYKNKHEIIAGLILLFLSSLLLYKYFFIPWTDTSLNGSEVKEKAQNHIPLDVRQEIDQQRKLYALTEMPTYRVPILMYHYIEPQDKDDKIRASLTTNPYTLDAEIKTLKDSDYTFMTAFELSQVINGKKSLPGKPVLLTFDDGYRDFYTYAYPILKRYNVPATQYVITGYLNNPNHLTVSQLQEIARDNLVEIGAHTVTHDWLKGKNPQEVTFQVSKSKEDLEKLTGKPVNSFAYPYGAFDLQAAKIVDAAGYTNSVSTIPGIIQSHENRFFLYRLRPGGRTGESLINWLTQSTFRPY